MRSIKKNNKGFTLLELVVTVALIISILAIAIVSFSKISDKKKEESKEKVIEQIKTAGEQFLESNEAFIKQQFVNGNSTAYVTLNKLVKEGLLNKVINPVTGQPFNECSKVYFKKENNKIKIVEFTENDNEEETCEGLVIRPIFKLENKNGADYTPGNWTNKDVFINLEKNDLLSDVEGEISEKFYYKDSIKVDMGDEDTTIKESAEIELEGCISEEKCSGRTKKYEIKIDKIKPTCKFVINGKDAENGITYIDNEPTVKFEASDEGGSNIKSSTYSNGHPLTVSTGNNSFSATVRDNAGNEASCSTSFNYTIKEPKIKPIFKKENKDGEDYTPGNWTNKSVYVNIEKDVDSSDITEKYYSLVKDGWIKIDNNGHTFENSGKYYVSLKGCKKENECDVSSNNEIKIDKIKPTCSFEITGGVQDSSGVYTSKPTVKFKASDEGGSDIKSSTYSNDQTLTVNTGNNSFSATVRDNAGNERSCSASINYTIKEPNADAFFLKNDNWNNQYSEEEGWTNSKIYAYLYKLYDSSDLTNKEYSLDGSSYKNIDESAQINGIIIPEGSHTITFRYKDASSNWKYTKEYTIKSDYTAPSCSYVYSGGIQNSSGVYTSKPTITFRASDTGGSNFNCSSSSYAGSCSGSSYSANVGVTEGSNNLSAIVYDNAGNPSEKCSTSYTYNSKEPALNVNFYRSDNSNTYIPGNWVNSRVNATVNPTNESSEIVTKEYNLNNSGFTEFNSAIVLISGEGTNTIKFRATDSAGKQIITDEYEIKIDTIPPSCNTILINDNNDEIVYDENKWYNSNDKLKTIEISANDENGSGISGTASYVAFVPESNVATNYQHSFKDLAGNTSICSSSIKNDRTAPEAKISRSKSSTKFNFEATDNLGLSQYKYTYDSLKNSVGYNWVYQDVETGEGKTSKDGTFKYNINNNGKQMIATRSGKVTGYYDKVNNVENTSDKMVFIVKDIAGNESNLASKATYNACDSATNMYDDGNIRRESVYHLQKVRGWGPQGNPLPNSNDPKHFSCEYVTANDGEQYYVAYYMIHSYQCECTKDNNINKLCSVNVPKITDSNADDGNHVTKQLQLWPMLANNTYRSTEAQMMRIYYTNEDSCNSAFEGETSQINQNVKYICNTGKDVENASGKSLALHGYQWYYDSNKGHMNSFSNFGWYHTGGCFDYGRNLGGRTEEVYNKDVYNGSSKWASKGDKYKMERYWQDNNTINTDYMKKQCEIACKKNVGQINYTKNSDGTTNYKVCTDSGNAINYDFDNAHITTK